MSSALAIAAVTAVMKNLIENRLIQKSIATSVGDVSVTALAPDRVPIGADERSQLNLFLYQVTPNSGWRGPEETIRQFRDLFTPIELKGVEQVIAHRPVVVPQAAPTRGARGRALALETPAPPPPVPQAAPAEIRRMSDGNAYSQFLGLDLHYLLCAYGEQDFHAEILLGHAIQMLLETPVLTGETIKNALGRSGNGKGGVVPPAYAAIAASTLADQIERIEITPEFLSVEEMSKLWSALQAHYRPSASYKVSMVVMEAGI
jgi:Pvc16 N-terminal domain